MIASETWDEGEDPPRRDPEDLSDCELDEDMSQASDPAPLDPSDRAVISRAAEKAQVPFSAAPVTSVFDRCSQCRKSEGLPILPDFVTELQSSWKAPSTTALPKTQLANVSGAEGCGLATVPLVGPTFAMLAGATARPGRDATHPNKRCRVVDVQLCKAYQASALAARLSGTSSLLFVYLEGLLQDLGAAGPSDEISEMLKVVDMLIRGASADAGVLGQSMASMVQTRHQVWLSQTNFSDQDYTVVAAPVVPREVFGLPSEAALEQSRKAKELTCNATNATLKTSFLLAIASARRK